MKKLMAVLAAMAFVVVMAGGAWADVTGDVDINATVSGKCNAITANDLTLQLIRRQQALSLPPVALPRYNVRRAKLLL